MSNSLLSLFLPSYILDYFEIVNHETIPTSNDLYTQKLTIYLEEKLDTPKEFASTQVQASGFMYAREIDDYPIRDMIVKLNIKRGRWNVLIDGKMQKRSRDWNLVFKGTRMSKDYSAFLKEISRY